MKGCIRRGYKKYSDIRMTVKLHLANALAPICVAHVYPHQIISYGALGNITAILSTCGDDKIKSS